MPQDPYGYQVASPAATSASPGSAPMWTGFFALLLALLGPCTCYVTSFLALPLGAYAAWTGMQVRDASTVADQREMALNGMLSGLFSSLWSLMWITLILMYVLLYVFIFGFAMIGAAAGGGGGGGF